MRTVKIGIIGCGGIAKQKHLPSLKADPRAELVAFCDLIEERAQWATKEYGAPDAKVYTDYRELLRDPEIEVVHVLTPNRSHCELTCDALRAGKHVMCEKPMAKTYADAKKMLETAKETGKKLTIGYQNRFRPDSQYLKGRMPSLGEVYYARAHALRRRGVPTWGVFLNEYEQGGGPLIDIGTHALDLTLWEMDNYEPASVMGCAFKKLGKQENQGNILGHWDVDKYTVEDAAMGFITMKNGAVIVLESSWALNILDDRQAKCTLCGVDGGADMNDGLRLNYVVDDKMVVTKPDLEASGVDYFGGAEDTPGVLEARQWLDAVINDTEPLVLPEQAIVVTRILEAIYTSGATGRAVYFDED